MLDTGCWILDAGYWMLDTGCCMPDDRGQRSEDRGQRSEVRGQMTGVRRQGSEVRRQMAEDKIRRYLLLVIGYWVLGVDIGLKITDDRRQRTEKGSGPSASSDGSKSEGGRGKVESTLNCA
ncbi:hypothetical protein D1AOALGA4SA_709 [Olavius algarvensis Delta 1 endosymbiont]|nr:hypothetical protein D1AOALGA4SA_709 [Olavius algarvensis Delta 1 endosymbiont]